MDSSKRSSEPGNGIDYRGILVGTSDAVIIIDSDQRVVFINPAGERMFRCKEADVLGTLIDRFIPERYRDSHLLHIQEFGRTGESHRSMSSPNVLYGLRPREDAKGFEEFPIAATISQASGCFGVAIRDISDQVRLDAERQRLETALRERTKALELANQRKDEFLALLGHELRGYLSPIVNTLGIFQALQIQIPSFTRGIEVLLRQVGHLVRITGELYDSAAISQGKIALSYEQVKIALLISTVVEDAQGMAEEAGITLVVEDIPPDVVVDCDPTRLSQVLRNLLTNACKYTHEGGIVRIQVTIDETEGSVTISVQDSGIGIAAADIPTIFEQFTQLETGSARRKGLGLGLPLVQKLVELHGGEVTVSSQGLGHGTTFCFSVPIARAGSETQQIEPTPPSDKNIRVLIIEDNRDAAESLADLLSLCGYITGVALTGKAGVEQAKAFAPDIILSDVDLPDLSGYVVAEQLASSVATRDIPLVALSGFGTLEVRIRLLDAGFHEHIVKPVDPDKLMALIDRLTQSP